MYLDDLQAHLLDELNYDFDIFGISEPKISSSAKQTTLNLNTPGSNFVPVPTHHCLEVSGCIFAINTNIRLLKEHLIKYSRRCGSRFTLKIRKISYAALCIGMIILQILFKIILTSPWKSILMESLCISLEILT